MTDEIYTIIGKRIVKSELSAEEKAAFEAWLLSDGSKDELAEIERLCEITANVRQEIDPDVNTEWDKFKLIKNKEIELYRRSKRRIVYTMAIAASILVLISITLFLPKFSKQEIVITATSNSKEIILPDNSVIWLNENSKIVYTKLFGENNRDVHLSGEAYFKVQKSSVPFVVNTNFGVQTRVLGTKFYLSTIQNQKTVKLHVVEGLVAFGKKEVTEPIRIAKNESAEFDITTSKVKKSQVDINDLSWHTRRLVFNNTPLSEVKLSLETFLSMSVSFPEGFSNLNYSGSFSDPQPEDIANTLGLSFGWNFEILNEEIVFRLN